MELEKQVVSLQLAKKLKKLGMKQDSIFYYVDGKVSYKVSCSPVKMMEEDGYLVYSAFTVAELGDLMPKGTWVSTFFHSLEVQVCGKNVSDGIYSYDTEANARAKMLIYLIENKLVEVQK